MKQNTQIKRNIKNCFLFIKYTVVYHVRKMISFSEQHLRQLIQLFRWFDLSAGIICGSHTFYLRHILKQRSLTALNRTSAVANWHHQHEKLRTFWKKYGSMMPPIHKPYETVTFVDSLAAAWLHVGFQIPHAPILFVYEPIEMQDNFFEKLVILV